MENPLLSRLKSVNRRKKTLTFQDGSKIVLPANMIVEDTQYDCFPYAIELPYRNRSPGFIFRIGDSRGIIEYWLSETLDEANTLRV